MLKVKANLYDLSTMTDSTYINSSGGTSTSTGFACTDYIEVVGGGDVYFSIGGYVNSGGAGLAWYDEDKTFISFITGVNYGTYTADVPFVFTKTAPLTAKYVRLSVNRSDYLYSYPSKILSGVKTIHELYKANPSLVLPNGYIQLDRIISAGNTSGGFINTNYTPVDGDVISITFDVGNVLSYQAVLGSDVSGFGRLQVNGSALNFRQFNKGVVGVGSFNYGVPTTIVYEVNGTTVTMKQNGTTIGTFSYDSEDSPLVIAASESSTTVSSIGLIGSIYGFKVVNGSAIKMNLIPAKRTSDNHIAMYDTVTSTMFENSSSSAFTAGDATSATEYIGELYKDNPEHVLPSGYTQLSSMSSIAGTSIVFPFTAADGQSVEGYFQWEANANGCMQGYSGNNGGQFWGMQGATNQICLGNNASSISALSKHKVKYKVDFTNSRASLLIDDTTTISRDVSSTSIAYRINGITSATSNVVTLFGSLKVYNASDVIIHNYVPCFNSSSATGFYDTIDDSFFAATFTAGAEVSKAVKVFDAGYSATVTGFPATLPLARAKAISYTISGNASQSSTPTPSVPVDVEFTGDKTVNLFNRAAAVLGDINSTTGAVSSGTTYRFVSDYIPVSEGDVLNGSGTMSMEGSSTEYAISFICALYDSDKTFVSGSRSTVTFPYTVPSGASYIRVEGYSTSVSSGTVDLTSIELTVAKSSTAPTSYIPYGYQVPIVKASNCGVSTVSAASQLSLATVGTDYTSYLINNVCQGGTNENATFYAGPDLTAVAGSSMYARPDDYPLQICEQARYTRCIASLPSAGASTAEEAFSWLTKHHANRIYFREQTGGEWVTPMAHTMYLDEPLRSSGGYSDTVNSDGTRTNNIGVLVLGGTENFVSRVVDDHNVYYLAVTGSKIGDFILDCTHFVGEIPVAGNWYNVSDLCISCHNYDNVKNLICIRDDSLADTSALQTYLAAQYAAGTPVTVYYPLATPTTETVTAPEITAAKGTNYIEVTTDVAPSSLSVTYRKKTK